MLLLESGETGKSSPDQSKNRGYHVSTNGRKKKAATKFQAKVEKVIEAHPQSGEPEKAQIAVEGADHLYRELRVPNKLVDEDGNKVTLKVGTEVEVKIEAEAVTAAS
jgi:hypothetical protein